MEERVIKDIYDHMGDDLSKEIYMNRLNYSITSDEKYMFNIILQTKEGQDIWNKLYKTSGNKVLFGAGRWGENILKIYHDIDWKCVIDNSVHKSDKFLFKTRVISFENYLQKMEKDDQIVISSRLYHKEIYEQLIENGFKKENIIDVGGMIDDMSLRQYFDLSCWMPEDNEVFIDGGSFDGITSVQFTKWSNGQYKKIYAFEPDPVNYRKCIQLFQKHNIRSFKIIPKGLWSDDDVLDFSVNGNGTSKIELGGGFSVNVTSIDRVVEDSVTFIKFDLEGAELQALLGAKETICRCKPKLAISIYHKPEDVWEIPKQILEFCPDYTFYLRHYSIAASETVLYASRDYTFKHS